MNKISIKEKFENQIEELWNNPKFENIEVKKFGYAQQDNQSTDSLLFIGINPSNSEGNSAKYFYINGDVGTHPYFNKFIDISKEIKLNWCHLDLFFVRETNQNTIKNLVYSKNQTETEFMWEQLLISKAMIEMVKPKIVVVNNSLSRDLLGFYGGWLNYKFEFDNELGTRVIQNDESNLKGVPVFFTSMLTGQRALDIGSYERLVWHLKMVNEKLTNNN
jgi:hypothetical protein